MIYESFSSSRSTKCVEHSYGLVVVGGGLTGVCAAITAARAGITVALVQDRPVLGGNASSEVRLWALGATSHMGNNNRWAREGGVIDEILVENTFRNKEGNPVMFDMVLIDKVLAESNITLLLNTVVFDVVKSSDSRVDHVVAYNPAAETKYILKGEMFADCSGDGVLSYMAGVSYRMGAESGDVYGEGFAPNKDTYGELMGHSIFFYMKDSGKPVTFVTPDFAIQDVEAVIPKISNSEYFSTKHHGCKYWWLEYGGRLDTIHDTEDIKRELWKVVYGIWGYIKNSGKFPDMENYTLEWAGLIPGKRESRRFEGLYTINQKDLISQNRHYDAVAYGGWSIDLHPADGVYASGRACNQWHSKGIYQIPFRCLLGSQVENLMFGGRIASASHVANGSTRVMCTSAHGGQAIGMAAALSVKQGVMPAYFVEPENVAQLQKALIDTGQFIPNLEIYDENSILSRAKISASSTAMFDTLPSNGKYAELVYSVAQILPLQGVMPRITIPVVAKQATKLTVELRRSSIIGNYTPDVKIESQTFNLEAGEQSVEVQFAGEVADCQYVFICLMQNTDVSVAQSDVMLPGVMTVYNQVNIAVSNYGCQTPPDGIGVEAFEFWCPKRRPEGGNIAMSLSQPLDIFAVDNLRTCYYRPFISTNAWAPALCDDDAKLTFEWDNEESISSIRLFFDADADHAMETTQFGHHDSAMPQCVAKYSVELADGTKLFECDSNHQAVQSVVLPQPVVTDKLIVKVEKPSKSVAAALYGVIFN